MLAGFCGLDCLAQGFCTLVGDTQVDVLAGRLAGVPVIGYANKPGESRDLADVQAAQQTSPR